MDATTASKKTLSMKLLVDTKAQRVLFAEASKEVVDFLFFLLALPLGAAVRLLGKGDSMVGSVGNIYSSVEKLDPAYVAPGVSKDALLEPSPSVGAGAGASSLLALPDPAVYFLECMNECRGNYMTDAPGVKCLDCDREMNAKCRYMPAPMQDRMFFTTKRWGCGGSGARFVTDVSGMPCPCRFNCGYKMTEPRQFVPAGHGQGVAAGGFVQGIATYTVTDDLAVAPMSSSVVLLSTFAPRDLGAVQEKTVQVGHAEGLEILRASLQSKTVLTDVFLGKEKPRDTA